MTDDIGPHCTLLDELDARQDDVLAELDKLNRRIQTLLQQFTGQPPEPDAAPSTKAA